MKTSELIKILKKQAGATFLKHGGEHDFYYCPKTGNIVQVHRHQAKEVPTGTANKILRDAGLK